MARAGGREGAAVTSSPRAWTETRLWGKFLALWRRRRDGELRTLCRSSEQPGGQRKFRSKRPSL